MWSAHRCIRRRRPAPAEETWLDFTKFWKLPRPFFGCHRRILMNTSSPERSQAEAPNYGEALFLNSPRSALFFLGVVLDDGAQSFYNINVYVRWQCGWLTIMA